MRLPSPGDKTVPPNVHGETAPARAWRRWKETFAEVGGGTMAVVCGAVATVGVAWLSEGRSLNERVLIAVGLGISGAVGVGVVWYLALLVLAPYRQRDAARDDRARLLGKLEVKANLGALLDALDERLELGVKLRAWGAQLTLNEGASFETAFTKWNDGNIEALERLVPEFVADYKSAEEPVELSETRSRGSWNYKHLPADARVEIKLRSLGEIRRQLRAAKL